MQGKKLMSTNQISKYQTSTKLIALYDKLKAAPTEHYAQLHAQGEKGFDGASKISLIGIVVNDYSAGTGEASVRVTYNLSPEQIRYIFSRINAGVSDFDFRHEKSFGTPDQSGMCQAQAIVIMRRSYDKTGNISKLPWIMYVSNGRALNEQKPNGGYRMVQGTYVNEKSAFIEMTDEDAYALFAKADSCIKVWEIAQAEVFLQGRNTYEAEATGRRVASRMPQWTGQGNGYAGYAQQQQTVYGRPYYQ